MNRRSVLTTLTALGSAFFLPCQAQAGNAQAQQGTTSRRNRAIYRPVPIGYIKTGQLEGVPPIILYGVALQESEKMFGKYALPYPWTLNVAGKPKRYTSYSEAVHALKGYLSNGITSVDCGLMQVNWRYHHKRLESVYRALDPYPNLHVGASILREHHRQSGNWFTAVGRYHAPVDVVRAKAYAESVYRRIAKVMNA